MLSKRGRILRNGAVMPHYEYFHTPGIDRLSRNINQNLAADQVSSVAHQMGKIKFYLKVLLHVDTMSATVS